MFCVPRCLLYSVRDVYLFCGWAAYVKIVFNRFLRDQAGVRNLPLMVSYLSPLRMVYGSKD